MFGSLLILAYTGAILIVPVQFQGEWRVSLSECPPEITDRPVWINANKIRMDHAVGELRMIENGGRRDITVAGELLSDGDPWNAKLRLKLSKSEDELTISEGDWATKRQRCPEKKMSK